MAITFMKCIALEPIVGSTSAVAKNRYLWSITNVGTLDLVSGLIVIPISITIGWMSQFFEDRFMAAWLLGMSIVGMLVLVDVTDLVDHCNLGGWMLQPKSFTTFPLSTYCRWPEVCIIYGLWLLGNLMSHVVQ